MIKKLLLYVTGLSTIFLANINAQQLKLSDSTKVSILTCDTGNELHTLFGHTAIRINDPQNGFDAVYNFGYFDFNTPNFYWKFVKGNLKYFVAVDSFDNFINEYVNTKRGVYEQNLQIGIVEKQKIFDKLTYTLQSNDRYYTYKFIDKNCSTMVADIISQETNVALSANITDNKKTNRKILYGYLDNHFFENLGINVIFGHKVDSNFYKVFLPLQLRESLQKTIFKNNINFSSDSITLTPQSTEKPKSFLNNIYSLIIILLLVIFLNKKWLTIFYFTMLAIVGIFLFAVGFYSFHEEVWLNYNVIIFNPLYIFLIFCIINKNNTKLKKTVKILILFLIIYAIYIADKSFISLVYPIIIANSILLYRTYKYQF